MPSHAMRDFAARAAVEALDPTSGGQHLRPIDLVHLSRQSLGDRALEIELLALFERQAEQIAARLATSAANGERRWRHDLAHTLKGSARAVGAMAVAAAAQAYEEALYGAGEPAVTAARDALLAAVAQARSAVLELLGEG
jgi:HPt (histidine-containing phosphotransfer) domain-containing protein